MTINWNDLLKEMGVDAKGTIFPDTELLEGEQTGCTWVKFMSDGGIKDNEQGDAFAKWLGKRGFKYERVNLGTGPCERRKFVVATVLEITTEYH